MTMGYWRGRLRRPRGTLGRNWGWGRKIMGKLLGGFLMRMWILGGLGLGNLWEERDWGVGMRICRRFWMGIMRILR